MRSFGRKIEIVETRFDSWTCLHIAKLALCSFKGFGRRWRRHVVVNLICAERKSNFESHTNECISNQKQPNSLIGKLEKPNHQDKCRECRCIFQHAMPNDKYMERCRNRDSDDRGYTTSNLLLIPVTSQLTKEKINFDKQTLANEMKGEQLV